VNKIDSASQEQLDQVLASARELNPAAMVLMAKSPVTVEDPTVIEGKRVIVIEDGPTLTHGEMQYGAGVVAAKQHGAAEIVDPRQYATGSMKEIYAKYRIGPVLPAMGYSDEQLREFEHMVNAADADGVVIATPIDLRALVRIDKPATRVRYDLDVQGSPTLADALAKVL
jgi:predicted GTPase